MACLRGFCYTECVVSCKFNEGVSENYGKEKAPPGGPAGWDAAAGPGFPALYHRHYLPQPLRQRGIYLRDHRPHRRQRVSGEEEPGRGLPLHPVPGDRGGPGQDHHPAPQAQPLCGQPQLLPAQRHLPVLCGEKAVLRPRGRGPGRPACKGLGHHRDRPRLHPGAGHLLPQRGGGQQHRGHGHAQQPAPLHLQGGGAPAVLAG